jgi:hypothetical protein
LPEGAIARTRYLHWAEILGHRPELQMFLSSVFERYVDVLRAKLQVPLTWINESEHVDFVDLRFITLYIAIERLRIEFLPKSTANYIHVDWQQLLDGKLATEILAVIESRTGALSDEQKRALVSKLRSANSPSASFLLDELCMGLGVNGLEKDMGFYEISSLTPHRTEAMFTESAGDAHAPGFMAKMLVQTTLPHRAQPGKQYNGRLGRLLITFMLCEQGVLRDPILYLSLYFKANRNAYYELLDRVRSRGDWEAWLDFFLIGVRDTADQAASAARRIVALFAEHQKQIETLGRPAASVLRVFQHMQRNTFASWYMMNGGDLYELAKLLGHANIKMTERYAKLGRAHITKTGNTAKVIWSMLDKKKPKQEEGGQEDVA